MGAYAFIFGLVVGAAIGWLAWEAVKPPWGWGRFLNFMVGIICLLIVAAVAAGTIFRTCVRVTVHGSACLANLKQVQGAKEVWALDFRKATNEVPRSSDLFGMTNYINVEPTCPAGGSYTWGAVGEKATCSFGGPGHDLGISIEPQPARPPDALLA
jgi:hypothetical protein